MSARKRLLSDLRVVDLRAELERRNLDMSGVRGVLIQRLSKYIEDDGHDPATYMLDISNAEVKSTPTKRIRRIESTLETPTIVDMIVQDDVGDDHDAVDVVPAAEPAPVDGKMDVDNAKPCLDSSLRDIKDGTEATQPITTCLDNDSCDIKDNTEVSQHKESILDNHLCDIKDDTEATQPIKPCHDDDHKGDNNMDTEDTINLELCEDELLNEEIENTIEPKKDDGAGEDIAESTGNETAANDAVANDAVANDAVANDAVANDAVANDAVANDAVANDAVGATDSTTSNDQQVNAEAPATSNEGDEGNEDNKDDNKDGEKRKDDTKQGGARNLWVSGLSGATRATDLKRLCSKYGKVTGAKVVTDARTPGSRCYGYVTLASPQDAENCIKNLHKTKLHGRMMSVEKARSESESSSRRQACRPERRASRDGSKENEDGEDGDKKDLKPKMDGEVPTRRSALHSRGKSHRSDKKEQNLERARELKRARDQLRVHRALERERRERRVAAEKEMHERARRQRREKHLLALELEQLRAERIKIEREKIELLQLERERHRLERERLELERLELQRAQLRLEVERRGRGYQSSAARRSPPAPAYERARHERPAPAPPRASSSRAQLEVPPPPRFDTGAYDRSAGKRDRDHEYKRGAPQHVSSGNIKYLTNGGTNDGSRQASPPGSRPKEPSRTYESRDSRAYRPGAAPPGRAWGACSRYTAAAAPAKAGSGNEAWAGAAPRYAAGYETRCPPAPAHQPPPPGAGAAYPDRYYYRKY